MPSGSLYVIPPLKIAKPTSDFPPLFVQATVALVNELKGK
jgi:hypothetical protein